MDLPVNMWVTFTHLSCLLFVVFITALTCCFKHGHYLHCFSSNAGPRSYHLVSLQVSHLKYIEHVTCCFFECVVIGQVEVFVKLLWAVEIYNIHFKILKLKRYTNILSASFQELHLLRGKKKKRSLVFIENKLYSNKSSIVRCPCVD